MGLFTKRLPRPTVRPNVWITETGDYYHFTDVAFQRYNRDCRLCGEKIYLDYGQHMVLHNDGYCNAMFHRECFDPWARRNFRVRGRDGKSIVNCPRCARVMANVCPGVLPRVPPLPPKDRPSHGSTRRRHASSSGRDTRGSKKRSWWNC